MRPDVLSGGTDARLDLEAAVAELTLRRGVLAELVGAPSLEVGLVTLPAAIGPQLGAEAVLYWELGTAPVIVGRWCARGVDLRAFQALADGPAREHAERVAASGGGIAPPGIVAAVVRAGAKATGVLQAIGLGTPLNGRTSSLLGAVAEELGRVAGRRAAAKAAESPAVERGRDPVTGLLSHASLDDELRLRTRPGRPPFAFVVVELDGFDTYRSQYGEAAASGALIQVAQRWSRGLRVADRLARWGEGSFAALLPGADADVADAIAQRLVEVVPHPLRARAGVAVWDGFRDVGALFAAVDCALFETRESGRSVVEARLATRPIAPAGASVLRPRPIHDYPL